MTATLLVLAWLAVGFAVGCKVARMDRIWCAHHPFEKETPRACVIASILFWPIIFPVAYIMITILDGNGGDGVIGRAFRWATTPPEMRKANK